MHINLILIPFVIALGVLMSSVKDTQKNRLIYILLCSVVLLFVAAMRNPDWMLSRHHLDTLNYKRYFENSLNMEWQEVFAIGYLRYFQNSGDFDIGFVGLSKLIGLFTSDFYIYSLLADLLFFIPFGYILYHYCSSIIQVMFGFVFYISLVQVFLLGGARQIFALGFHLMALISIINGKKIRALLLALIGISIHFSSFVFLVPLFFTWFKLKPQTLKLVHLIAFILFPVVFAIPNELIVFMGDTIGMDKYAEYGDGDVQGGGTVFIFLIEALSLFCLLAIKKRDLYKYENIHIFYIMAPLFTVFAPLIRSNGTMIRMSLYFHLFLVLLVPYAIDCMFRRKDRGLVYCLAIVALSYLALAGGGITYKFFWQL